MKRIIATIGLALTLAATAYAHPNEHGVWVCKTVASAGSFAWAVNTSAEQGVTITSEVLNQIAANQKGNDGQNLCGYVESDSLKPVLPNAIFDPYLDTGYLLISDGKHVGWVTARQYTNYMVFHLVRKQ
jgi:hypothetical protein